MYVVVRVGLLREKERLVYVVVGLLWMVEAPGVRIRCCSSR